MYIDIYYERSEQVGATSRQNSSLFLHYGTRLPVIHFVFCIMYLQLIDTYNRRKKGNGNALTLFPLKVFGVPHGMSR
jgi:hypothetical protein